MIIDLNYLNLTEVADANEIDNPLRWVIDKLDLTSGDYLITSIACESDIYEIMNLVICTTAGKHYGKVVGIVSYGTVTRIFVNKGVMA